MFSRGRNLLFRLCRGISGNNKKGANSWKRYENYGIFYFKLWKNAIGEIIEGIIKKIMNLGAIFDILKNLLVIFS